ncbi:hypothetical protein PILCRDRAFT_759049 [Piloderma croceum F 1598]|uniref:Uncharacterized protein n=1 Tax=Piloderma croceum (strain F 1598) TaxID=765440 RepID=A0A0C3ESY2_PILCF|nr:hypothetical protein PILCRDRAFT_759049 [Piloderma croceum F 1598]
MYRCVYHYLRLSHPNSARVAHFITDTHTHNTLCPLNHITLIIFRMHSCYTHSVDRSAWLRSSLYSTIVPVILKHSNHRSRQRQCYLHSTTSISLLDSETLVEHELF